MNRLRLWGLSTALVASLGAAALAGDPNMAPDQTTLVQKLFGPRTSKPSGSSVMATPATINAPLSPEVRAKCLHAEQEAYLRRMAICFELRRVADEKGDKDLSRQADVFEGEAWNIYNSRVAALGVSKLKAPLPEPKDIVTLDEPATPKVAANRLTTTTTSTAAAAAAENTSDIREVKP